MVAQRPLVQSVPSAQSEFPVQLVLQDTPLSSHLRLLLQATLVPTQLPASQLFVLTVLPEHEVPQSDPVVPFGAT
jgi:hypothetical protein